MVARTPQKQRKVAMVAPPLNSDLLRETISKVDKCMERLQELQYTIAGGTKVVSGVSLSPRSTRTYLKTSLRCKQETLRIKNASNKRSPIGKFPASSPGDWRKMSLPAMLLGETVNEILQASQVTRDIVDALAPKKSRKSRRSAMPEEDDGPKTPETQQKPREPNPETVSSNIKARRKKEKQNKRSESDSPPSLQRARSRIVFRTVSPQKTAEKVHQVKGNGENSFRHLANRVSPKHKPWVKKAVLFPNPLFISGSSTQQAKFSRTMSPVIARNDITSSKNNKETPHKFLIKSPPTSASKFQVKIKSPPKVSTKRSNISSNIKARRKKEKQNKRSESDSPPSLQRARSRIVFRTVSPQKTAEKVHQVKGNGENSFRHLANRVSPKHKPWVKKAVLFPNPLFISGSSTQQAKFSRTMSPVIARNDITSSKNNKETPHKFLIKSPPTSASKFQVKIKSPPKVSVSPTRNGSNLARKSPRGSSSPTRSVTLGKKSPTAPISPIRNLDKKSPKLSTAAKLRRSFTPTRNGSSLARKSSISPKRVTLQAFISPTRNGNLGKKSPKPSISPTRVGKKTQKLSTAAKLRRSFSPSRLAMRLVSPLKNRKSVGKCDEDEMGMMVTGLKQRPVLVPKRFSMGRI